MGTFLAITIGICILGFWEAKREASTSIAIIAGITAWAPALINFVLF